MKQEYKFSLLENYKTFEDIVKKTDKRTLAIWAIDCAERVLPYFENAYPRDKRPRKAIETIKEWLKTGIFKMKVIRKASLDSHAAARRIKQDSPAKSAARAAGHAVATLHVPRHSIGSAIYALQAISRANPKSAIKKECTWQYNHLIKLRNKP